MVEPEPPGGTSRWNPQDAIWPEEPAWLVLIAIVIFISKSVSYLLGELKSCSACIIGLASPGSAMAKRSMSKQREERRKHRAERRKRSTEACVWAATELKKKMQDAEETHKLEVTAAKIKEGASSFSSHPAVAPLVTGENSGSQPAVASLATGVNYSSQPAVACHLTQAYSAAQIKTILSHRAAPACSQMLWALFTRPDDDFLGRPAWLMDHTKLSKFPRQHAKLSKFPQFTKLDLLVTTEPQVTEMIIKALKVTDKQIVEHMFEFEFGLPGHFTWPQGLCHVKGVLRQVLEDWKAHASTGQHQLATIMPDLLRANSYTICWSDVGVYGLLPEDCEEKLYVLHKPSGTKVPIPLRMKGKGPFTLTSNWSAHDAQLLSSPSTTRLPSTFTEGNKHVFFTKTTQQFWSISKAFFALPEECNAIWINFARKKAQEVEEKMADILAKALQEAQG